MASDNVSVSTALTTTPVALLHFLMHTCGDGLFQNGIQMYIERTFTLHYFILHSRLLRIRQRAGVNIQQPFSSLRNSTESESESRVGWMFDSKSTKGLGNRLVSARATSLPGTPAGGYRSVMRFYDKRPNTLSVCPTRAASA